MQNSHRRFIVITSARRIKRQNDSTGGGRPRQRAAARYLEPKHRSAKAIAFLNPDGAVVIIAENNGARPLPLRVKISESGLTVALPPASWSTIVAPAM